MNRTIKEGDAGQRMIRGIILPLNVKRFHEDDHNQLRTHLADFMAACNFARRLKTLASHGPRTDGGPWLALTPYDDICKIWTSDPDRSILNPIHQMPELNN